MLGYKQAKKIFAKLAGNTPKDMVAGLIQETQSCRKERAQEDDITFVALKIK